MIEPTITLEIDEKPPYQPDKSRWRVWAVMAALLVIGASAVFGTTYRFTRAIDDPLRRQKAPVLDVQSQYVVRGMQVNANSLQLMMQRGICRLSGEQDMKQAWRRFVHDEDVIAIVFSPLADNSLSSNDVLAKVLVESLVAADFKRDNIMVVGLADSQSIPAGTRPCRYGWQSQTQDFGSGEDYLPVWLEEVTAIINVPSLMDDNIIGLRGAIANLGWPMIKRPARFYLNGGDPFLTDIYNMPQIRGKVRLHLMNALRVLYYGGPEVRMSYIWEYGSLLFSRDPVALDAIGLELLKRARQDQSLPRGAEETIKCEYLKTAYSMGLGFYDLNFIAYQRIQNEAKDASAS